MPSVPREFPRHLPKEPAPHYIQGLELFNQRALSLNAEKRREILGEAKISGKKDLFIMFYLFLLFYFIPYKHP